MYVRGLLVILLFAAGLALAPGCRDCEGGDAAPAATPAEGDSQIDPESESERVGDAAPRGGAGPVVRVDRGQVTLVGAGARLSALLRDLAREGDFALEFGVFEDGPVFARLEAAPMRDALAELLTGVAYGADYVFDPRAGGHRLARLRVGAVGVAESAARRSRESEDTEEIPRERVTRVTRMTSRPNPEDGSDSGTLERDRYVRRWDGRDQEEYEADLEARLMSWDAVQRREAVEEVDAEGEDLARVLEFATRDEDPEVRAAAVAQLGHAQSFAALRGVVRALDDPDARVVLQAIESLEETGDASFLAELARLRDHPDPQVRAREAEASEYLAD